MTDAMPRPRPPHLCLQTTQHGSRVWYVRVGKGPRIRIRSVYGTPEFAAEYQAAISGTPINLPGKAGAGTLAWLVARYRDSQAWASFSNATKRQRENILKHVLDLAGKERASDITRKHIVAGIDRRRETPAAARHFLETMRGLFRWAVNAEHVDTDPTRDVNTPRRKSDGHHVWSEEEVERFEARWPVGTRARLALDVLLYTGLRRGDACRLGRQHVRNGIATFRTEKTGEPVTIVILPALARSIAAGPCGEMTYIVGEKGRPMAKESFGNWFRSVCNQAGVPGSAHGLRKCGATRAANDGATGHQLMAMFGWTEPRTAAIYTRKANREALALAGAIHLKKGR